MHRRANVETEATSSKLCASRVRRQRNRERNLDENDLEQRFGKTMSLSLSARVFVPASPCPNPVATASPKRSMAFVTERRRSAVRDSLSSSMCSDAEASVASRCSRRSVTATVAAKHHKNIAAKTTNTQRNDRRSSKDTVPSKIRRHRTGTKGQTQSSAKAAAVTLHERHRRKLSLTSMELQTPDILPSEQEVMVAAATIAGHDVEEVYPDTAQSAFPQQLTLFSQQKRLPQRVASRDDVIDTIFNVLFTRKEGRRNRVRQSLSAFGDDTGTETDEPNEEFVKRGLANALFRDQFHLHAPSSLLTAVSPATAVDSLITPSFMHALVNALRFEDFRTASVRLDILRAIHKSCPTKRLHLARALADATALRVDYVAAVAARVQTLGVEKTSTQVITDHPLDHAHGFTELLRYSIEHIEENMLQTPVEGSNAAQEREEQQKEVVRNCMVSLVSLWRAHWVDPAGSDDEELITCAGQFVAYMPSVTSPLLKRLLSAWPTRYPKQEVGATRMVARVLMSGPPLQQVNSTQVLQRRIFTRLARTVQSLHVDVAKEALAFTGCQFVLVHFLGRDEVIYKTVTEALHANIKRHWHHGVRDTSETNFDRALDFAP